MFEVEIEAGIDEAFEQAIGEAFDSEELSEEELRQFVAILPAEDDWWYSLPVNEYHRRRR